MITVTPSDEKTFYIKDHEWINFQDTVAYAGVCSSNPLSYKHTHEILLTEPSGFKKRGEIITIIKYDDYRIEDHVSIDGQNTELMYHDKMLLFHSPKNEGSFALILPTVLPQQSEPMPLKVYGLRNKNKII